jgi:hypothetical protein
MWASLGLRATREDFCLRLLSDRQDLRSESALLSFLAAEDKGLHFRSGLGLEGLQGLWVPREQFPRAFCFLPADCLLGGKHSGERARAYGPAGKLIVGMVDGGTRSSGP